METTTKNLKTVTTALSNESVTITIFCSSEVCVIDLPVRFVDPRISLQFAGAVASSPKIPCDADSQNN